MQITSFEGLISASIVPPFLGQVISFDFFDTLIFRKVSEDEIIQQVFEQFEGKINFNFTYLQFLTTKEQAYSELASTNAGVGRDRELTVQDWYIEIFRLLKVNNSNRVGSEFVKRLVELECENLQMPPNLHQFVLHAKAHGTRLIIVSDTYYQMPHFKMFLKYIGLEGEVDQLYLSSEVGLNKAGGRLFEHVLKCERIANSDMLHIGDNHNSDIYQASKYQIQTIHYNRTNSHEKGYSNADLNNALIDFGRQCLGPMLLSFCQWLKNNNNERYSFLFLARDSYLPQQIFKFLYPQILNKYTYINRVIVNQLKFSHLDQKVFQFINDNYRAEGISGLEKAFGLYDSLFSNTLKEFCLSHNLSSTELLSESIENLCLANQKFVDAFNKTLFERQELSTGYLKSLFEKQTKGICLVDIGWKASIFKELTKKYTEINSCKLFCYVGAKQQGIEGFIDFNSNGIDASLLSQYRDLIEWACSEDIGALLYIDSKLSPVFAKRNKTSTAKNLVQKGVWEYITERNVNIDANPDFSSYLTSIPDRLVAALSDEPIEFGIDGVSGVTFKNILQQSKQGPGDRKELVQNKQANLEKFMSFVRYINEANQLVVYGFGTGFNFVEPHLKQIDWIVDINSYLHGKLAKNVEIKSTESLSEVVGVLLVTIVGRRLQLAPLVDKLSCEIIYLEDYL